MRILNIFVMSNPKIILNNDIHRGQEIVTLRFDYNQDLIAAVKKLNGAKWSQSKKCWYLVSDQFNLSDVFNALHHKAFLDYSNLKKEKREEQTPVTTKVKVNKTLSQDNRKLVESFIEWMEQQRYRKNTVDSYRDALHTFLGFFRDKKAEELTSGHVIEFNTKFILANGYSPSYQNQGISAIKLFYQKQIKSSMDLDDLERPKRGKHVPKVIAKEVIHKKFIFKNNIS